MYKSFIVIIASLWLMSCSDTNESDTAIGKAAPRKSRQSLQDANTQEPLNIKWDSIVGQQKPGEDQTSAAYKPTFFVSKNDIVLGNADSKVVLVEYFSPTCPHCAYYHKVILPELKKKYIDTNKIAYVIREFIGNKQDLDAAILARCQHDTECFVKFHTVILDQQEKWVGSSKYRDLLTNMGQIGGVSPETYAKCLNDNEMIEILFSNTNLASGAKGFVGTPAFFINGIQIKEGYGLDILSKFIDRELAKNAAE